MTGISGMRLAGCRVAILHFVFSTKHMGINSFFKNIYWGMGAQQSGMQFKSQTPGVWRGQRDAHLLGEGHCALHCHVHCLIQ